MRAGRGSDEIGTNLIPICVEECLEIYHVWMGNESHDLQLAIL